LIKVPVDPETGAADVKKMKRKINNNTCLLVGSAPSFSFGIMDPIEELGELALAHNLPLHVDACLGGFINAFAEDAGFSLPRFDFSVPGVTSISLDTHKYGQTPKGTSVLLFHPDCAASPTHVHLEWVGGMYVTEGLDGSRSGADIATTWAVLCAKGRRTYVEETRVILTLKDRLVEAIDTMDGIYVAYNPLSSMIGICAKEGINELIIANQLKEKGFSVNILQTPNQEVDGFHFCLTSVHAHKEGFFEQFTQALSESLYYAKAHPHEQAKGIAKVYGKLKKGIPFFVQEEIGRGYVLAHNTIRTNEIVQNAPSPTYPH
jgi:glutamate/tyrosine decarboxylase-like PLP-dependent enzyme